MDIIATLEEGGLPISIISSIPYKLLLSNPLLVSAVTCVGMVEKEVWEEMAAGAGIAVVKMGITSTGLQDKGTHNRFLLGDGEVL